MPSHIAATEQESGIAQTPTRSELIERLRTLRGTIPSDFKFDRVDANERAAGAPTQAEQAKE